MADIREKIKKLLALAESPNENEARDALLKARELMAKNKLSEQDLGVEEVGLNHIICEDVKWTTDSGNVWVTDLCKVIAENYACTTAWNHYKGKRTYTLKVTGIGEDAEICAEAIKYAYKYTMNAIKVLQRKRRESDPKAVANSYAKGFILGLELMFEEQKDDHPEWALMVVTPQEVQDYTQTLSERNVRSKKTDFDLLAYMRGQNDGSTFSMNSVLAAAE